MRVLITGGTGMLGHKLYQRLSERHETFATVRGPFDSIERFGIFDKNSIIDNVDLASDDDIARSIEATHPNVVINAAGIIKQRPSSKNIATTLTINSILPHKLAALGQEYGFRTIIVSTDCVFSGAKGSYTEDDPTDANDLYGISKRLGEITDENCLTLRTSIIGRELSAGHSLVEWFLSNRGRTVKGFSRAIYSGFPTTIFADIIDDLLSNFPDLSGLYHISSDPIDKCELLELVNSAFNSDVTIEADDTFSIDRSLDSTKFRQKTSFEPIPWVRMIDLMASDPTPYGSFVK